MIDLVLKIAASSIVTLGLFTLLNCISPDRAYTNLELCMYVFITGIINDIRRYWDLKQ